MHVLVWKLVSVSFVFAILTGCADPKRSNPGAAAAIPKPKPVSEQEQPLPPSDGSKKVEPVGVTVAEPPPPAQPREEVRPPVVQPPAEAAKPVTEKLSPQQVVAAPPSEGELVNPLPLLTNGRLEPNVPYYQVPDRIRERLEKFQPNLFPKKSDAFDVINQKLRIDANTSTITFSGDLKVQGKKDEHFELSCKIDKEGDMWECNNMLPTDPILLAQRRFQGTFKCLPAYQCDAVGVKLWVVIDGKLQEPKQFQGQGFSIRAATSGDAEEGEEETETGTETEPPPPPPAKQEEPPPSQPNPPPQEQQQPPPAPGEQQPPPPPQPPAKKEPPKVQQPPRRPQPAPPPPAQTEEEIDQLLNNPDATVEITEPLSLPEPGQGENTIPGIVRIQPPMGNGVRVQAVGYHAGGVLKKANGLPAKGPGFVSRDHGNKDFATDLTVDLITKALHRVETVFPNRPPIVIGNIAGPTGGRLKNTSGRYHASHQTGLDADIGFPSNTKVTNFWAPCSGSCSSGRASSQLDVERLWLMVKQMACAEGRPIMAIFVSPAVKQRVCQYVKNTLKENTRDACVFKALQVLRNDEDHYTHIHVRFRCPENRACQNSIVTLSDSTGCR